MRLLPPTLDSPPVIIVTGSREFTDVKAVIEAIDSTRDSLIQEYVIEPILHVGDCPTGADRIAAEHWLAQNYGTMDTYVANWPLYGKSAGPTRNIKMMQDGADIVLAFPLACDRNECANKPLMMQHWSHGTRSALAAAKKYELEIRIFTENFTLGYFGNTKYDENYFRKLADLGQVGIKFRSIFPLVIKGWPIHNADTGVIL